MDMTFKSELHEVVGRDCLAPKLSAEEVEWIAETADEFFQVDILLRQIEETEEREYANARESDRLRDVIDMCREDLENIDLDEDDIDDTKALIVSMISNLKAYDY